ncbi:hypothetical protein ACM66B_005064 [Microbotryomycetes sp. NB124-2]
MDHAQMGRRSVPQPAYNVMTAALPSSDLRHGAVEAQSPNNTGGASASSMSMHHNPAVNGAAGQAYGLSDSRQQASLGQWTAQDAASYAALASLGLTGNASQQQQHAQQQPNIASQQHQQQHQFGITTNTQPSVNTMSSSSGMDSFINFSPHASQHPAPLPAPNQGDMSVLTAAATASGAQTTAAQSGAQQQQKHEQQGEGAGGQAGARARRSTGYPETAPLTSGGNHVAINAPVDAAAAGSRLARLPGGRPTTPPPGAAAAVGAGAGAGAGADANTQNVLSPYEDDEESYYVPSPSPERDTGPKQLGKRSVGNKGTNATQRDVKPVIKQPRPSTKRGNRVPHALVPKIFECTMEDCDKKFARKSDFMRHYRIHTGEKPFVCEVPDCQKSFRQATALTVHMRVHSGEKPYACPDCPRAFSDSSSLARHRRLHSGEKPFKCEKCQSKTFARHGSLKRHLLVCTGLKADSPPPSSETGSKSKKKMSTGRKPGVTPRRVQVLYGPEKDRAELAGEGQDNGDDRDTPSLNGHGDDDDEDDEDQAGPSTSTASKSRGGRVQQRRTNAGKVEPESFEALENEAPALTEYMQSRPSRKRFPRGPPSGFEEDIAVDSLGDGPDVGGAFLDNGDDGYRPPRSRGRGGRGRVSGAAAVSSGGEGPAAKRQKVAGAATDEAVENDDAKGDEDADDQDDNDEAEQQAAIALVGVSFT